jgi:hypothetical protein
LVQFILPTHHSYNLENLVHYFGIKHDGEHQAHRALADAVATARVLENLLQLYNQFSQKLKSELQSVINRGEFVWQELFSHGLQKKDVQQNDSLSHSGIVSKLTPLRLSENLITVDNTPANHEARLALGLQETPQTLLVVQDANTVMRLWQDELVHGVFREEDTFSKAAFHEFMENSITEEELRFCLKIIVWLHTNWQTEVVFDLNISFFGIKENFCVLTTQLCKQYKLKITGW